MGVINIASCALMPQFTLYFEPLVSLLTNFPLNLPLHLMHSVFILRRMGSRKVDFSQPEFSFYHFLFILSLLPSVTFLHLCFLWQK